jgi:L-aminopeptidase/D-esterase
MTSYQSCGLVVGHATDAEGATGCTVIRGAAGPFRCAVHVVGRATGTRELALLEPGQLVDRVDAILLAGGSAYGLDAAAGVMRWWRSAAAASRSARASCRSFPPRSSSTSRHSAASTRGRPRRWVHAACEAAVDEPQEGSVGAGTGATVGKAAGVERSMKGGIGIGAADANGVVVRALAVVNAVGDVRDASGRIVAGARDEQGRFIDSAAWMAGGANPSPRFDDLAGRNTTLCVVSTNAALDHVALASVARAASAALYRRITPVGTQFDGDVVFATAPCDGGVAAAQPQIEALAVQSLELAIERGVRTRAPGDILR